MSYRYGQTRTRKNATPEQSLQSSVREYLGWCLHPSVEWTANAAGVPLPPKTASTMKNCGVRPGWPDLQFLFPDGVTRYIELKRPDGKGTMSPMQKAFAARCAPHSIHAVCKSLEEVETTLRGWGAPLKRHPFAPREDQEFGARAA